MEDSITNQERLDFKTVSLDVEPWVWRGVKSAAAARDLTVREAVGQALVAYFELERPARARPVSAFAAPEERSA